MPARTAQDIHPLFLTALNSGSVEGLLELYEEDASFVTAEGTAVSGKTALRQVFLGFLSMKPSMKMETVSIWEGGGGDLALLSGRWTLEGLGPDASPLRMTGTSQEVARRGSDGCWRYAIDDPGVGR